jgi:hypothetical protein
MVMRAAGRMAGGPEEAEKTEREGKGNCREVRKREVLGLSPSNPAELRRGGPGEGGRERRREYIG